MRHMSIAACGGRSWAGRLMPLAAAALVFGVLCALAPQVPLIGGVAAADLAPPINGWQPLGISGGGSMFVPSISPADPDRRCVKPLEAMLGYQCGQLGTITSRQCRLVKDQHPVCLAH